MSLVELTCCQALRLSEENYDVIKGRCLKEITIFTLNVIFESIVLA